WGCRLIAKGVALRRLGVPVDRLACVRYLRTAADAEHLRVALASARRVAVIGGGFIGLEVASLARSLGREVTLLERAPAPLARLLPSAFGHAVAELLRARGVEVRTRVSTIALEGEMWVQAVRTDDGARIPADLVVVGIGVRPELGWLAGTGVATDDGIPIDPHGRTNLPEVFAAGDVAAAFVPLAGRRMRLEHYGNAAAQGAAAGAAMAGGSRPHVPVPGAGATLAGARVQVAGVPSAGVRTHVRGSVGAGAFLAYFLDAEDRLVGAFALDRPRELLAARRLLGQRVDPAVLLSDRPVHGPPGGPTG
ncbi:MAG: NAD(P)/FAD-dependent oxidoreductase, partial [Myxococcales bacterium]